MSKRCWACGFDGTECEVCGGSTRPRLTDDDLTVWAERLKVLANEMDREARYGELTEGRFMPVIYPSQAREWARELEAIELALRAARV